MLFFFISCQFQPFSRFYIVCSSSCPAIKPFQSPERDRATSSLLLACIALLHIAIATYELYAIADKTAAVTRGCPSLLFSVMWEKRPVWSNMDCARKQAILALMKQLCSRLSWGLKCWMHANTMGCGTERVGFGMNCELPVKRFCFQSRPTDDWLTFREKVCLTVLC